jgi:aryl-alcohol dehydrogenase-like predicted oxidoreductase
MEYIKLGTTGLDVSPIAIGAMTYGEPDRGHPVWSLGETDARPLIRHALDVGINFFDTANMYSQGSSEEILGRALRDFANRDDIVIATKLRNPMRSGPNGKGLSRKAIMTEVEHSLTRLGTDYIDLYQVHRNDHTTPLEETLGALHDLVKAGKVRYLGEARPGRAAWLRSKPVVTAPLVGASTVRQIDDAAASLGIELHEAEIRALEAPYTPRYDFQGISDDADLQAVMARLPQFTTAS